MYNRPIPTSIIEKIPAMVADVTDAPTNVEVYSFPDNDDNVAYAVNVEHSPRSVVVADRRRKGFVTVKRTEFTVTADGEVQDRYDTDNRKSGNNDLSFPSITEEDYENERRVPWHG